MREREVAKEGLGLDWETIVVVVVSRSENRRGCHRTLSFGHGGLNEIERERVSKAKTEIRERFRFEDHHWWWWRQTALKELESFWSWRLRRETMREIEREGGRKSVLYQMIPYHPYQNL